MGTINNILNNISDSNSGGDSEKKWKPSWNPVAYLIAKTIEVDGVQEIEIVEIDARDTFLDFANHLAVECILSDHRPFHFHNFAFGMITSGGRFMSRITPRVEGWATGQPKIDKGIWAAMDRLQEAAEGWQERDVARQLELHIARKSEAPKAFRGPGPEYGQAVTPKAYR